MKMRNGNIVSGALLIYKAPSSRGVTYSSIVQVLTASIQNVSVRHLLVLSNGPKHHEMRNKVSNVSYRDLYSLDFFGSIAQEGKASVINLPFGDLTLVTKFPVNDTGVHLQLSFSPRPLPESHQGLSQLQNAISTRQDEPQNDSQMRYWEFLHTAVPEYAGHYAIPNISPVDYAAVPAQVVELWHEIFGESVAVVPVRDIYADSSAEYPPQKIELSGFSEIENFTCTCSQVAWSNMHLAADFVLFVEFREKCTRDHISEFLLLCGVHISLSVQAYLNAI